MINYAANLSNYSITIIHQINAIWHCRKFAFRCVTIFAKEATEIFNRYKMYFFKLGNILWVNFCLKFFYCKQHPSPLARDFMQVICFRKLPKQKKHFCTKLLISFLRLFYLQKLLRSKKYIKLYIKITQGL